MDVGSDSDQDTGGGPQRVEVLRVEVHQRTRVEVLRVEVLSVWRSSGDQGGGP